MTAQVDQCSNTVRELIRSCYEAQQGFQTAAEAVEDATLKRLLAIYAQQRTRFAQELRDHAVFPVETDGARPVRSCGTGRNSEELLRQCLESDERVLALYREALANRALPTRAHFLVSAQCSLLERVRDRMEGLLRGDEPGIAGLARCERK